MYRIPTSIETKKQINIKIITVSPGISGQEKLYEKINYNFYLHEKYKNSGLCTYISEI